MTTTATDSSEHVAVDVLQRFEDLATPESAELLLDGRTVVVTDAWMVSDYPGQGKGLAGMAGAASIQACILGDAPPEYRRLAGGLSSTLGVAVMPRGTAALPAGTLVVSLGGARGVAPDGRVDPDGTPALLFLDPQSGDASWLDLGRGSAIAERCQPFLEPNGIAADSRGDVYVTDLPHHVVWGLDGESPSAIYRIPNGAIDGLLAGDRDAAPAIERVIVPGGVNGCTVSYADDSVWLVTCSRDDPANGGVYQLSSDDFTTGTLPPPRFSHLGGARGGFLDGVTVTRRGTVIVSVPMTGALRAFTVDGRDITFDMERPARNPADINAAYPAGRDGEPILLVPDVSIGRGTRSVLALDLSGF